MSNLGWPTATPEPTAEHRRLGWADSHDGVSRETAPEEPAHPGGGDVVDAPAGSPPGYEWPPPDADAGEAVDATVDATDVLDEGRPAEAPNDEEVAEPSRLRPTGSAQGVGDSGSVEHTSDSERPEPSSAEPAPPASGLDRRPPLAPGEGTAHRGQSFGSPSRAEGLGAALRSNAPGEARASDGRAVGADIYFTPQDLDDIAGGTPRRVIGDHGGNSPSPGTEVAGLDGSQAAAGQRVTPPSGTDAAGGSGSASPELVAEAVDNNVDNTDPDVPPPHESVHATVGENRVDDREPAAPAPAVSVPGGVDLEPPIHVESAPLPPADDEHAVAENLRRHRQLAGRPFPKPVHSRVMTVANQKGGVGKTTTTVNVAAAMAQSGLKVLVIDLDPQGNASTALGIDHHAEVPSIYDVLVEGEPLLDVVQPCTTVDGLFCAPATIDLAGAEIELVSLVARESRLQKAIAAAGETGHDYDYILIDCPPSLGLLTVNAMVAATEVFIPIQCEYYALEGLSQLLKNIELVRAHLNPDLHVSTILLTMYDGRTRLSAQVADEVREHFPEQVLRITVPRSVRVSEAPSFGETVMTYDPTSSGALAYLEAAGEIADRGAAGVL